MRLGSANRLEEARARVRVERRYAPRVNGHITRPSNERGVFVDRYRGLAVGPALVLCPTDTNSEEPAEPTPCGPRSLVDPIYEPDEILGGDERDEVPCSIVFNVRLAPKSRHWRGHRWMSAFDPKQTWGAT